MIPCPNCGKWGIDDGEICKECGYKRNDEENEELEE